MIKGVCLICVRPGAKDLLPQAHKYPHLDVVASFVHSRHFGLRGSDASSHDVHANSAEVDYALLRAHSLWHKGTCM
jgi:hypothetical protein